MEITHLFIDEAAQALEPAALVPISNLLNSGGQLVLAGDPKQLGPVCISRSASDRGLGKSRILYIMAYADVFLLLQTIRSSVKSAAEFQSLIYFHCITY